MRAAVIALLMGSPACASLDPAVPYRLPDDDWAVGLTGGVAWDESASPMHGGGALVGVDASWLDDVFGLHAGVRIQREGQGERVSGLVEATAWYVLMFGVGVRAGEMVDDGGPGVPNFATDLTFLVALPIPLWHDCVDRTGALVVAPYARPGFRLTGGDRDSDDLRGFHEIGVMLRWTSFAF